MSLVTILTHACTGCGICVESCPMDVLRMNERVDEPRAFVAYADDCQACMLCVFDCPRRAVEVRGADYDRLTLTFKVGAA
jgi:NAD-dependent dihydropyrimidine dehydrogenase PreA subunit